MARAWFTSCDAFSSNVMRDTRSLTRFSIGRAGSRYGGLLEAWVVCASAWNAAANRMMRNNGNVKTRHSRMPHGSLWLQDCSDQAARGLEMRGSIAPSTYPEADHPIAHIAPTLTFLCYFSQG